MLDPKFVRDDVAALREAMRRRDKLDLYGPLIDEAEALDRTRRASITRVEERKAERNRVTQEVGRLKKAKQDATELQGAARVIGEEIAALEAQLEVTQSRLDELLLGIPNVTLPDVPAGDESHNVIVRSWGTPRAAESVMPHWELGERLGLFDLPRGAKVSGSGFIVYRGAGARLVRSLMNLMLDLHTGEFGYEETWVPVVVNRATMTGTGQLPKFEDDMYALRDEDLFLIPTAEVPVTNLYRDEILAADELPKSLCAYSPCFRREAGSAGKDTRGLLRVHEFDKVELVRYCAPEDGEAQLELLLSHAEAVLQRLGLPYRVALLAAGDTGFASAKTYDLEVFAPGVGKWLEVSSCSLFTDFQGRRANIRYRPAPGEKPRFVHTLNASGLAFPRVIAALLEHGQQADGSVVLPPALAAVFGRERLG
ncbi:MAG: serine--tRNA ligase [Gemmatimonadaceae bacterium]|nr:serine--tRNA ligase [Gemmatimonadaceae bacterium]MCW5825051.1 serine--tRNA ligase [Gemmatimonadaceae bacterium]